MVHESPLNADQIWRLLLALRRLGRSGATLPLALDTDGRPASSDAAALVLTGDHWHCRSALTEPAGELLELYLPLFQPDPRRPLVLAHLGQSLDGCIATAAGHSAELNDSPNIDHLHRLRALSDAILVGAGTVDADNPQLTTRRVAGDSPVRVILDPRLRLKPDHRLFHDNAAPTLVFTAQRSRRTLGRAEIITLSGVDGSFDLSQLIALLHTRGLRRIFVEGGGVTVSRFLGAGLLDRLQITVAPLMLGAGRRGLQLPPAAATDQGLRPACRRFPMGRDVLFDFDLRAQGNQANRST